MNKLFRINYYLLLIMMITAFSSFKISADTIMSGDKRTGSANFWKEVFLKRVNSFDYYSEEVDYLISRIQNSLDQFREETVIYDSKFHQLKFIMSNVIDNPYETRLIITEMNNLYNSYSGLYNEIKLLNSSAETYIEALDEMKEDLDYLSIKQLGSPEVLAAAIRLGFDISILKCHLELGKKRMTKTLKSMKSQIEKLISLHDFVNKSLVKQLQMYFFIPGMTIWEIDWNYSTLYSFKRWINTLPISIKERMPDSGDEFLVLIIAFAIVIIVYLLIYFLIIKKLKLRTEKPEAYSLIIKAAISLFAFIGLFLISTILIFPETIIFYRLGVILFGCFAWLFTITLKVISRPEKYNDNYLLSLFIMFSVGIVFQILSFNYVMFALIWPLVIILAVGIAVIKNRKIKKAFRNYKFYNFLMLMFILFILSIKGYIYLSVFISMIFFLGLVTLRMGLSVIWMLHKLLEFNKNTGSLKKAFIAGIGTPLIWLSVFMLLFIWASMQISSNPFILFKYLYHIEFSLEKYDIRVFKILVLVFTFFVFKSFLRNFTDYLHYSPFARKTKRQDIIPTLKNLSSYICWSVYLVIILFVFKINIMSIMVVIGGLSVGIGFGLQHIFNNFISGVIIMFGKTCRAGDIIELDGRWATVIKTDIRTTVIKTFDNCIITVPNSLLIDKVLYNWTSNNDLVRKDIKIGVEYGSDVEKVTALLIEIAKECKDICSKPEPQVIFSDFGDSALIFSLRFWLEKIDNVTFTPSKLRYEILKRFNQEGIVIAYPQIDIHMKDYTSFKTRKKVE